MGSYPPQKVQHWIRVLKKLGFEEVHRVGQGKHANKFAHPTKHTKDYKTQRNFIIIPHKIYPQMSDAIVKELSYFGITEEDIKGCC